MLPISIIFRLASTQTDIIKKCSMIGNQTDTETKQKQTFYILKLEENLKLLYKLHYKVISKYF